MGRAVLAGCAVALAVGVAGCAAEDPGVVIGDPVATSTAAPTPTGTTTPAPVPCRTADLERGFAAFVLTGRSDGYGTLELTNTGSRPCTLSGWSTLRLGTPDDAPIEVTIARAATPAPATVRLAQGGTAVSTLRFLVQPPDTRTVCHTPTTVEVVPPGRTDGLRTLWPYGRICSTLTESALRPEG